MSSIPAALTADDCPLLKKKPDGLRDILRDYSAATAAAEQLRSRFPKNFILPEVQEALGRLAMIRERLTRTHLKVGFLGPFQCGKSTTLNNLLGKKIAGTGAGKATTSVITRLIIGAAEAPERLRLRYFTVEEYFKRRETLCSWAGLPNAAGLPEAKVLELLKSQSNPRGASANRPILPDDVPYLRAFLQSFETSATNNLVRATSLIRDVDYSDKDKYLTHSHGKDGQISASDNLLISEATIHFSSDTIDPVLELVDCPGLGSGRSVDDLLTEEYISQLDGALLFLRADSMYSAQVFSILNHLKRAFANNLQTRVWVIVNKMDAPARDAKLEGDAQGKTTFDLITQLHSQYGIPLSQVCMGCNEIYGLPRTESGTVDRTRALNALKLEVSDEAGLKAKLDPGLHQAFEEMLQDGSIGLLRRLMKDTIAPSVADGILKETLLQTQRLARELKDALERAEKPASIQDQRDARRWENALLELLHQSSGCGGLFARLEELGTNTRKILETELDQLLPPDEVFAAMDAEHILERFEGDAEVLQTMVDEEFRRVLQVVFSDIATLMKARSLPNVTLPCGRDPLTIWDEGIQNDRENDAWRGRLQPVLFDPVLHDLLRENTHEQSFSGPQFKRILRNKLRASVHQMSLAVRSRVRYRLNDLHRQIGRLRGSVSPRPVSE